MLVIEVRDGELLEEIELGAKDMGITDAAIVTLIGAADSFTLSTMPATDATKDVLTDYDVPAEMTATGELVDGKPHIHAVMAIEGDRAVSAWNSYGYGEPPPGEGRVRERSSARHRRRQPAGPRSPAVIIIDLVAVPVYAAMERLPPFTYAEAS